MQMAAMVDAAQPGNFSLQRGQYHLHFGIGLVNDPFVTRPHNEHPLLADSTQDFALLLQLFKHHANLSS